MSLKVARYDLATHGRALGTRELGREVGRSAADRLAQSELLMLNFFGVDVASPSFLDEVTRALRAELSGGDTGLKLLVTGANEDVTESLTMVLERAHMVLGAIDGATVTLLGGNRQLQATMEEAQRMGAFNAPDLAERLEIKLPALHQRLRALTESGAIARDRHSTAERGRHSYEAAAAPEDAAGLHRVLTEA